MALVYFPFRSKAYGHCWRAFSSLCSPSPFVGTGIGNGEECIRSQIDIIVSRIREGSSDDEVFKSLVHDEACNAIPMSQNLVDVLLHRFKDDWKSALGLFRWAESRLGYEHAPEAYDMMVDILGKLKQVDKMRALMEEMRQGNLVRLSTKNTESMNLLLDTLCKERKVEQARAIFLELKPHISPNTHTFNIFIHGWCKANRVDEAEWTIQEMKGHGCRPCVISYSTIIQSYCRQSNFRKVYELLDDMQAQGCAPNVVTYTTIMCSLTKRLFVFLRANKCEWGYNLFEEMVGKAITPRYKTCALLLDEIKQKNMHDAAERIEVFMKQMKTSE
ncbi:unnamed protein product, partial [Vitis vinifera]